MNELKNTKYEIRKTHDEKGFTLVEIVVAIGLMVIVVLFAGSIFKAGIGSYRAAMAQAEIMTKLRVITQQLDSDLRGLRKDAPMFIWFQKGTTGPDDANRFDQIMFFADGDFQSNGNTPVIGNLARIYYGHSQNSLVLQNKDRILARRQHISTADENILVAYRWPDQSNFINSFGQFDPLVPYLLKNDTYEYDWLSLSQWQAISTQQANVDKIVTTCFYNNRPAVNLADPNTLHLLMTERVGSFSVQWSYPFTDISTGQTYLYWWPSVDPDGNGNISDSDFSPLDVLNVYSNAAKPSSFVWVTPDKVIGPDYNITYPAAKPAYPTALKFTFTIYDSRGVFRDGQTFTHIVYIGE